MNRQVKTLGKQVKRVCDYFIVIGCFNSDESNEKQELLIPLPEADQLYHKHNQKSNEEYKSPPDTSCDDFLQQSYETFVIDRYPYFNQEEYIFPEGINMFCFPSGCRISTVQLLPTSYSFVTTSEDGSRVLGCCICIYEELSSALLQSLQKQYQLYTKSEEIPSLFDSSTKLFIPKCLCILTSWPFSLAFKKIIYNIILLSYENKIPIERVICNVVDDIPSPPFGIFDVVYYIREKPITFRCPPLNRPNEWMSIPLSPLFDCLDINNILLLFSFILVESQIVFISSQFSLLTMCTEAITSLLFPLNWAHAYIPILPLQLIEVLAAPFPFIVGVHESFLRHKDCNFNEDTIRVFLDENRIEFGTLRIPNVPEKLSQKLLFVLSKIVVNDPRDEAKKLRHLSQYDLIQRKHFKMMSLDERGIRKAFCNFFVGLLFSYRKYLIFGSSFSQRNKDNGALSNFSQFNVEGFFSEFSVEVQPFIDEFTSTQAFSIFIDERVSDVEGNPSVLFFDESIDAKANRYLFRSKTIDTPFLNSRAFEYSKTFVAPSPEIVIVVSEIRLPSRCFPRLRKGLFLAQRKISIPFYGFGHDTSSMLRLKKIELSPQSPSFKKITKTSVTSCIYSLYLLVVSTILIYEYRERVTNEHHGCTTFSTSKLLEIYHHRESKSADMKSKASNNTMDPNSLPNDAEVLGIKVVFEVLCCLLRLNETPSEMVYRVILECCNIYGDFNKCIEVLCILNDVGLAPDRQMLSLVARTFSRDPEATKHYPSLSTTNIWTIFDWRSYQVRESNSERLEAEKRSAATENNDVFRRSNSLDNFQSANSNDPVAPSSQIQWSDFENQIRSRIFAASKKLHRHMRYSENLLRLSFPKLAIRLDEVTGMSCGNKGCASRGRSLTFEEVYRGWSVGNANVYTTRCCFCETNFVPRFTVKFDGCDQRSIWFELISPWVLSKEVQRVISQEGIAVLSVYKLDCSDQRMTLFWNMIVYFRFLGLPYAFLFNDGKLEKIFPSKAQFS